MGFRGSKSEAKIVFRLFLYRPPSPICIQSTEMGSCPTSTYHGLQKDSDKTHTTDACMFSSLLLPPCLWPFMQPPRRKPTSTYSRVHKYSTMACAPTPQIKYIQCCFNILYTTLQHQEQPLLYEPLYQQACLIALHQSFPKYPLHI
jgi:hypothetical protein